MVARQFSILSCFLLLWASPGVVRSGTYGRAAEPIWQNLKIVDGKLGPSMTLVSPDRRTAVAVRHLDKDDGELLMRVRGVGWNGPVRIGPGVASELLWSPDPGVFSVTTSDGGANGPFRALVVTKARSQPRVVDLTPIIASAFGHPVRCGWPEAPNVGAIRWMGSKRLVVAAEIVAHSNCDSFGTFNAYVVDWPTRRIVAHYGQIEAKRRFGNVLGTELRGAPDSCITRPRSCWVATNHDGSR